MTNLTIDAAMTVASDVLAVAAREGTNVAVVVVDTTAQPIVAVRPPGVAALIESAARRKAAAAVAFGASTATLSELFASDSLLGLGFAGSSDVLVLPGGFLLHSADVIIGAVGIAGGHYSVDQAIGERALVTE